MLDICLLTDTHARDLCINFVNSDTCERSVYNFVNKDTCERSVYNFVNKDTCERSVYNFVTNTRVRDLCINFVNKYTCERVEIFLYFFRR